MSEFKKYPSIENHYQSKWIEMFKEFHPDLTKMSYILTEKIHGCNIQIHITKDCFILGKRTDWVGAEEKFNDIQNVVKQEKYASLIEYFRLTPEVRAGWSVTLYGELFGQGIQKGVDYGKEKQILFFDMRIDGTIVAPNSFFRLAKIIGIPTVPVIARTYNLQDALDFNTEFDSKILNIENNICEGVVIKPYYENLFSPIGEMFWIKKKNEKFKEVAHAPKVFREKEEINPLHFIFLEYINENRLESVFSKYGVIENNTQIGNYLKLLVEDARADFEKDHDVYGISKEDLKKIYNIGGIGFNLIKKYL